MTPICLDYNASTPIDPRVATVMRSLLDGPYANPSALHAGGREARAVTRVRDSALGVTLCRRGAERPESTAAGCGGGAGRRDWSRGRSRAPAS